MTMVIICPQKPKVILSKIKAAQRWPNTICTEVVLCQKERNESCAFLHLAPGLHSVNQHMGLIAVTNEYSKGSQILLGNAVIQQNPGRQRYVGQSLWTSEQRVPSVRAQMEISQCNLCLIKYQLERVSGFNILLNNLQQKRKVLNKVAISETDRAREWDLLLYFSVCLIVCLFFAVILLPF